MAATERILYGTPISVYSCKLRLALALKGVSLKETAPPGGYCSDEYRRIVPQGTIPALVEGDFVLAESDAIIEYLDDIRFGNTLLPRNPRKRARARALSRFVDMRLEPAVRALYPFVGAAQSVPHSLRDELLRALDKHTQLSGYTQYLSGEPIHGLPDCGYWAVGAVLQVMDEALSLELALPEALSAGDKLLSVGLILATYRQVLSNWVAQKREGA